MIFRHNIKCEVPCKADTSKNAAESSMTNLMLQDQKNRPQELKEGHEPKKENAFFT